MFLNYEPEKIEAMRNDFFIATGVKLGVCDENFKFLNYKRNNGNKYCARVRECEEGLLACRRSDHELLARCKEEKRAVMHICHMGLADLAVPVIHEKKTIAFLILGQIRIEKEFPDLRGNPFFSENDIEELRVLYNELSIFDQEKIESISNIATMMVKYILFEKMLLPTYDPSLDRALAFIDENFEKNLTISEISRATLVPKSSLYKLFHTHLGCTVSEYINSKRIDKAAELLLSGTLSVEEISEKLGFSTQQYFSRIFKKIKGVSPVQFRKSNH